MAKIDRSKTSSTVSRKGKPAARTSAINARVTIGYRDTDSLAEYANNPRDNAAAIDAVANSISEFGFVVPVLVDKRNVIIAGHTRVAAARKLGIKQVPVIVAEHLNDTQVNAFRVIDNKVAELASWDFDKLSTELNLLQGSGLVMTDYGWNQEELSCLHTIVADDCLEVEGLVTEEDRERMHTVERRAPNTSRFVLGEVTFFIQSTDYRNWIDVVRARNGYNEALVVADIKNMLGIEEAAQVAVETARRRRPAPR